MGSLEVFVFYAIWFPQLARWEGSATFTPPLTNNIVGLYLRTFREELPPKGNLQTPQTVTNEETRDSIYFSPFAKTRFHNLTIYNRGGRLPGYARPQPISTFPESSFPCDVLQPKIQVFCWCSCISHAIQVQKIFLEGNQSCAHHH